MRFPFGALGGNCIPELASKVGYAFRRACHPEDASQFERLFWDALSAERSFGRCIPFWAFGLGRIFRWRGCWESTFQIGEMQRGNTPLNSFYSFTSLSHVGSAVCLMPAVCSFFAKVPEERTSPMVKRTSGWP